MEVLEIAESKSTPRIRFDFATGILDINGKSIPEDAIEFYRPLLEAIDRYGEATQSTTTLNMALVYFNTSSSKCILKILTAFATLHKRMTKVKVNWYYDTDDEDQLETANDLEASSGLEFNYIGVDVNDN